MAKTSTKTQTVTTKDLAALAAAAIAKGQVEIDRNGNVALAGETLDGDGNPVEETERTTHEGRLPGLASPMMAASAIAEIAERQAEDADSVAHHVQRLTGGVPVREFEKALHTVASFLALPVKRIDPRTGEIVTFDMGRSEVEQMLNSVCYSAAKLLNPLDDFSTVAKVEKARERVLRDQRALSEGNEIDEVECRRNMDSLDYREVVLAGVKEAQEVALRVYKTRTGKDFKAPAFKAKGNLAKVTDQDKRNQLLAEMAKRTGKVAQRVEGDAPFDMATSSADPSMRQVG